VSEAPWLATHHWPPDDVGVVGVGVVGVVVGVVGFGFGFVFGVVGFVFGVVGFCPDMSGGWGFVGFPIYGFPVSGSVGLTIGTSSNWVPNSEDENISWFLLFVNILAVPKPEKGTVT